MLPLSINEMQLKRIKMNSKFVNLVHELQAAVALMSQLSEHWEPLQRAGIQQWPVDAMAGPHQTRNE